MDVSIIIVNHNTAQMTLECVDSIYEQTKSSTFEIIIVDNASSDGSAAAIRNRWSEINVIENTENVVFSDANNQAIGHCVGRHILLLNSDTVILDGAIDRMVKFLDAKPSVGIVGAKMYNAAFEPWVYETWKLSALSYALGPIKLKLASDPQSLKVAWVCGACLLIRSEIVAQIGLLDRPMYGEDVDWCIRAGRAGWDVWHLADAKIIHYWGMTAAKPEHVAWRVTAGRVSKLYYSRKHNGALDAWLFYIVLLFESAFKWVFYSATLKTRRRNCSDARGKAIGYGSLFKALLMGQAMRHLPVGRI